MTPSPDAERAPVDLDEHERDVRGFTGTFLYLDRFIDECETNYYDAIILAPDGIAEDDCPVIAHDIDDDVAEPLARILNRQPALVAELSAARERIAALVAALDEAADIAARGERACLDHIDRWRALAHPTEGDPAP